MDAGKSQESQKLSDNLSQKEAIIESLKQLLEKDLESEEIKTTISSHIDNWKQIGNVPKKNNNIHNHFESLLKKCYEKIGLSKSDISKAMYNNKLQLIKGNQDAIHKELSMVRKKIEETKNKLNQLENNLQFFADGSEKNPLVKKVHADIEKHQKNLEVLLEKKNQLSGI
jgi:predicted DNA-binding protein YlxM (UPF0122 family)